jgi:hypothetical protein
VAGYPTEALAVGDVDGDGGLDVVIATAAGHVIALQGRTGRPLDGFPVRLPDAIRAPPVLLAMGCVCVCVGACVSECVYVCLFVYVCMYV